MRNAIFHRFIFIAAFAVTVAGDGWCRERASVLTYRNDNARTGANLREVELNISTVNVNRFGKLFSRSVDGQIYAQPLYVPRLSIAGKGVHDVVYVATQHNTVYAFDAVAAHLSAPLWSRNLGPSAPSEPFGPNIQPEIGITSTPVIDSKHNTIYVVAKTLENSRYYYTLHALDLLTGNEKLSGPVVIDGCESGSFFTGERHLNRPGLLLLNDAVFVAFGSHADVRPYHGWVFGYNAQNVQQRIAIYNTTPYGEAGGIWQSGHALSADSRGYIYLITGDGTYAAEGGLGNSFVKLKRTDDGLSVVDWFTPCNEEELHRGDRDLGSSGVLLLPDRLLVGGGKEGVLYVLNADNMGRFHGACRDNPDLQIKQKFQATRCGSACHIHGAPVFWNSPSGPFIYLWPEGNDTLKAFKMVNDSDQIFNPVPVATSTVQGPYASPGATLSISANMSLKGTGIVWASLPVTGPQDATYETVPGILRAFDASDLSHELWNSKQNRDRDDLGNYAKFCPPTVANGKVYTATFSGELVVYGLLAAGQTRVKE